MLTPGHKVHVRLADGRVAEAQYRKPYDRLEHCVIVGKRWMIVCRGKPTQPYLCRFICTSNLSPERLREMMR